MALILDGTDGITSSGGTNVLQDDAVITANIADGAVSDAKIAAMAAAKLTGRVPDANAPLGSVIQVVSATKTDTFSASMASGAVTNVTGLAATITPSSATSKILVLVDVSATHDAGGSGFVVTRNETPISIGDALNSRTRITFGGAPTDGSTATNHLTNNSAQIFDEPNTAASVTYQVRIYNSRTTTQTHFVNRSVGDSNNSSSPRAASRITLLEIAA